MLLKPSCIFCVRFVSSVVVECSGLNPCCDLERGMCVLVMSRISLSRIVEAVHRRVMGLYDVTSLGVLLGFRIVMILLSFHIEGI